MQFLVYYCSTGMLQAEVINGDEKGSDLETIYEYNEIIKDKIYNYQENIAAGSIANMDPKIRLNEALYPNKSNYIFLDHSNGDFYWFNFTQNDRYETDENSYSVKSKLK